MNEDDEGFEIPTKMLLQVKNRNLRILQNKEGENKKDRDTMLEIWNKEFFFKSI
jgi:hypothetical protein